MIDLLLEFERFLPLVIRGAIAFAAVMIAAVVMERAIVAVLQVRAEHLAQRYQPLIRRALSGDDSAGRQLATSPARHRLTVLRLLIAPLVDDRDPRLIVAARAIAQSLSMLVVADRYLRSWRWWRRALALRAIGLIQARDRTADLLAALDDRHADVRAAALDALADLRDPASVQAIVVRLHDPSLHRGRRGAALKAFGPRCESFLLDLAAADPANRLNYAHALAICGTSTSRATLCRWTRDSRVDVRAAAFEALAYVGLDDDAAGVAVEGLDSREVPVRAMAAYALRGWHGGGTATRVARHLDDEWPVAVQAARTLQSMGREGVSELAARASGPDRAAQLARQMLWQPGLESGHS